MKPVKQTKLFAGDGAHAGNCLAACLASLLELPLWMVPPFDEMFIRGDYRERMHEWARVAHRSKIVHTANHRIDEMPEFYVANGPSPRGVLHSVIYSKGQMVHDPHFSNDGISEVDWTWHIERLPDSAQPEHGK